MAKRPSTPKKPKLVWMLHLSLRDADGEHPLLFEFRAATEFDAKRKTRKALDQIMHSELGGISILRGSTRAPESSRFHGNIVGELCVGVVDSDSDLLPVLRVARSNWWSKPEFSEMS